MRYVRPLILCAIVTGLVLVPCPGSADMIGPGYVFPPHSGTPSLASPQPAIRLESEQVTIRLGYGVYSVDALFHFFNTGETITERVRFPKLPAETPRGYHGGNFLRIDAFVNGRNVHLVKKAGIRGHLRSFWGWWASWGPGDPAKMEYEVKFPAQAQTAIRIRHETQYRPCGGGGLSVCSKAAYACGSGRSWASNSGKRTFIVDAEEIGGMDKVNVFFFRPAEGEDKYPMRPTLLANDVATYAVVNINPDSGGELKVRVILTHGFLVTAVAASGDPEAVSDLLDNKHKLFKVTVNGKDPAGRTLLMAAARGGHVKVAKLLLNRRADVNATANNGHTALTEAVLRDHKGVARLLTLRGAVPTTLAAAASLGDVDTVRRIIAEGADVNMADGPNGRAPLIAAAREGHLEVVRVLVEKGARPHAQDSDQETALMAAARRGHWDVVKLLLENGFHIDAKNMYGQTALMMATDEGHVEAVRVLLDKGADLHAKSMGGLTALALARENGNTGIEKLLRARGAKE
ncbi:MAG: ankyrin repeat domain-containing protein [Thermodesulfobacteriota bacterium]